jgi:HK97 family phage major capsid protein
MVKTEKGVEFKSLDEAYKSLDQLKSDQKKLLQEMKNEDGSWKATTAEQREQSAKRNSDIADIRAAVALQQEMKNYEDMATVVDEPMRKNLPVGAFGPTTGRQQMKSVGELLVDSDEYKSRKGKFMRGQPNLVVNLPDAYGLQFKASQTEDVMFAPPNYRLPITVEAGHVTPTMQRIIPTIATSERNAVPFMQQTTRTNNAAPVAQTNTLGKSVLTWTAATQTIETIGAYIEVVEQMVEDVPLITGLINTQLAQMQDEAIELQLISGNGTTPNLRGYLNATSINHQAAGTDDPFTAIGNGMDLNRNTGYAEPDYVVMNSSDFWKLRRQKDAIGNFIWGNPNAPVGNEILWGVPILTTQQLTSGTTITGAFRSLSARYIARGVTIEIGRVNTQFLTLEYAIRATQREALVIYRGSGFTYIDGLTFA